MPGKIERSPSSPRANNVERKQVETPSKTAPVSRGAVQHAFSTTGPGPVDAGAGGRHLARSARPDALWGANQAEASIAAQPRGAMDGRQFAKLTPAQRQEKLTELRAQRDALQVKILERVVELDKKWEKAPVGTKQDALKDYAETSEQLDPQTREELTQMVEQAEIAQRRIDRLVARREGMPPSRGADADTKRARSELAKELRAARAERRAAVKEATAVVDEQGLKIDRLAVTEHTIDPSAPKANEPGSLLSMVKDFFKFSTMINWWMGMIDDFDDKSSIKDSHEAQLQRELADHRAHVQKVEERMAIKKLTAAMELRKG